MVGWRPGLCWSGRAGHPGCQRNVGVPVPFTGRRWAQGLGQRTERLSWGRPRIVSVVVGRLVGVT